MTERKYPSHFKAIDLGESLPNERIFCQSGEIFARSAGQKADMSGSAWALEDPSDYCNEAIRIAVDDYVATGRDFDFANHHSLLAPYALILADKGYKPSAQSARNLHKLLADAIKGKDVQGPKPGMAESETTVYEFNPIKDATTTPFVVVPGLAVEVGAIWAALDGAKSVDASGYRGTEGIARRDALLEQCRLNNQNNPLEPAPKTRPQQVTLGQCFDAGAVLVAQHLHPDTANLEVPATPVVQKVDGPVAAAAKR